MRQFFLIALFLVSPVAWGRNIFLNGKDVSSATGKKLEGVNISIAENGDVYISAPQYQVLEEVSYTPLGQGSKDTKAAALPESRSRIPSSLSSSISSSLPDSPASDMAKDIPLEEKPGSKANPQ
ncbi:MAG: hypothetical protein WCI18_05965 [Pseudomonadota bacterium]